MTSLVLCLLVVVVVWRLFRCTRRKSPIAHIRGPHNEHWLKGNYHRITQDGLKYNLHLTDTYGGVVKVHGALWEEQLYISDPLALQHMVKEQDVYEKTDAFIKGTRHLFGQGLLSTIGEQHRRQRKILNPVFSPNNIRTLSNMVQPIATKLCLILESQLHADGQKKEINISSWLSRCALEYICQGIFGHSFDALNPYDEAKYVHAVRMLGPTAIRNNRLFQIILFIVSSVSLNWQNKILDLVPIQAIKDRRRMIRVIDDTSKEILATKKAPLKVPADASIMDSSPGTSDAQDIMTAMLKANTSTSEADRLSDAELTGNMNTVTFAGVETITSSTSRILWILAGDPLVQRRLCSEIRDAKCASDQSCNWEDVDLSYDVLTKLPYLDAVVKETLRLHPPASLLLRTARQDAVLPLHRPILSRYGEPLDKVAIPKGTTLIISILNANLDKKIWGEDAREWRPERWLAALSNEDDENRQGKAPETKTGMTYPGVYANMMTFIGGGRACIGFKFAEMEIKQIIVALLSRLHFSLPSTSDERGQVKETYWKIGVLQVPVVRPPSGDGMTPQMPLNVRRVREGDFEVGASV